jgi:ATP-dependent protease Clp ATPase subunit
MSDGYCSFCGKAHYQVFRLITSDGSKICNECIARCAEMIAKEYVTLARTIQLPPREDRT